MTVHSVPAVEGGINATIEVTSDAGRDTVTVIASAPSGTDSHHLADALRKSANHVHLLRNRNR